MGIRPSRMNMVVHSFQPTFRKNIRIKRCRPKHIYRAVELWKATGRCTRQNIARTILILDQTCRDLLSLSLRPALGIALSLLDQPLEANTAADVIYRNAATAADLVSNITPFSSVRRMKTITLSNDLRIQLVNDKRT